MFEKQSKMNFKNQIKLLNVQKGHYFDTDCTGIGLVFEQENIAILEYQLSLTIIYK